MEKFMCMALVSILTSTWILKGIFLLLLRFSGHFDEIKICDDKALVPSLPAHGIYFIWRKICQSLAVKKFEIVMWNVGMKNVQREYILTCEILFRLIAEMKKKKASVVHGWKVKTLSWAPSSNEKKHEGDS